MSIATQIERIQNEVNTQEDLIAQIAAALENKAAVAPTTFTFTIHGGIFTAVSGMTWEEWINSQYNTGNYSIYTTTLLQDRIVNKDLNPVLYGLVGGSNAYVYPNLPIWKTYHYDISANVVQ